MPNSARMASAATSRSARAARSRAAARHAGEGRIRWDRVGRVALLALLLVVLLLYIAPLRNWLAQSHAADVQRAEMRALERDHARLSKRVRELGRPEVVEREARRLGMVRRGERGYVIEHAR